MTNNQRRAVDLAQQIRQGITDAADLSEMDWCLLLLAADLNRNSAPPLMVADRVLKRAELQIRYFADDTSDGRNRHGKRDAT